MDNNFDAVALNPQPLPPMPVRVLVTRDVTFDLKRMQKLTASVLGRLGCPGCHSGHIIEFREIRDFIADPKTLDVREITTGFGR